MKRILSLLGSLASLTALVMAETNQTRLDASLQLLQSMPECGVR